MSSQKPLLLLILDGWGERTEVDHNAIAKAHTPNWDHLLATYPHLSLACSGTVVGLPQGQMGNSEVGHMHIGAGRLICQDLTRIDQAIQSGEFKHNSTLNTLFNTLKKNHKALHIIGLLSPGGIHSHQNHLLALVELAQQAEVTTYIHGILDGRDTPPKSALSYLETIQAKIANYPKVKIVSLIGRFYAMDRDNRWDRIKTAFDLYTAGQGVYQASSALEAIQQAYERGETDEFMQGTTIHPAQEAPISLSTEDSVCFMNFRADRARQLSYALYQPDFSHFCRSKLPKLSHFVTLTQYTPGLTPDVVFPPMMIEDTLGAVLSRQGLKQCRIAETEKYAHVTFFFNGGREAPFNQEIRLLIPSPKVKTYDLAPAMSVNQITKHLISLIEEQEQAVIICNFANADMVGHTGNFMATQQAIEAIDICLGQLITALKKVKGELLITADHGNAEYMYDENTGQPHTAHTTTKVPLVYMGRPAQFTASQGSLLDIAPTLLYLLNQPIPQAMTGKPLLKLKSS